MKRLNKKGFGLLNNLPTIVLLFGIAVIITSIVAQITGDIQANSCQSEGGTWNDTHSRCMRANTSVGWDIPGHATNISGSGLAGLAEIGNWFSTIGLIIGAIIVLSALFLLMQRQ